MRHRATSAFAVIALIAIPLIVTGACGKSDRSASAPTTIIETTTTSSTPSTTAPSVEGEPDATVMITPYFIRDGRVGAGQQQAVEGPAAAIASMAVLVAGPTEVDESAGLVTAIAANVAVNHLVISEGIASIDFNRPFETANTRPQVAQVVYTLTQFAEIDAVEFLIDGEPNGATGVMPIGRADLEDMTPGVLVESPTPGAALASTFSVTGSANTYEANVPWAVLGPDDSVIAQGTTTATSGTGTRGTFVATIDLGDFQGQASLTTWVTNMETGAQEQPTRIPIVVSG